MFHIPRVGCNVGSKVRSFSSIIAGPCCRLAACVWDACGFSLVCHLQHGPLVSGSRKGEEVRGIPPVGSGSQGEATQDVGEVSEAKHSKFIASHAAFGHRLASKFAGQLQNDDAPQAAHLHGLLRQRAG